MLNEKHLIDSSNNGDTNNDGDIAINNSSSDHSNDNNCHT